MANYIVNAYNNGISGGSVNMRSGPAEPTELGARVLYGATSCEVGREAIEHGGVLGIISIHPPHARWDSRSH